MQQEREGERERRIVGIVLVGEECRLRPELGRVGERERNKEMEEEGREGGGGAFWVECGQPLITSAG